MLYRWLLGLGVLCIGACAHQKNQQELRREAQRAQLQLAAPAELDGDDREWRAFKTVRARFYYDASFAQLEGNVQQHIEERVHRVNEVLAGALHARVTVESVRALPASPPGQADLDALLRKLAEQDEGDDVEVIITLVGALPIATFSFHDLGRAELLGKHIVIRSMTNAEETRALDTYDALAPEERSRMYQQRKRHKEATVMLHELGHSLGALHSRDATDIMHASYDSAMQAFSPHNLELMRLALDERLRPAADQDPQALAKALKSRLLAVPAELFIEQERTRHLASLDAKISPPVKTTQATRAKAGDANRDVSALSADDQKRLAELDTKRTSGDTSGAYEGLSELADKYPHTHFLQHEACETGMRLRRSFKEISRYCDRVAAAAVTAPASP
jgi:predicted Zn-dependent protease